MLTTDGKRHIKRYLAGYVPAIAGAIAFGVGDKAETTSDRALQVEVVKAPVNLTSYNFANNKLVYKASVPETYEGKIYEIGIYSMSESTIAGNYGSRMLTTFDSATEDWVLQSTGADASFSSVANRVGVDALSASLAASASETYSLKNLFLDLGGYSGQDSFTFAFNSVNANIATLSVRFMTDTSNYYDFSLGSQTAGYKVVELAKGAAAVTGNPDWSNITEIRVIVAASSSGAGTIEFDAIRIEDKDFNDQDYVLVARKVLPAPVTKIAGQPREIEFTLDVTL